MRGWSPLFWTTTALAASAGVVAAATDGSLHRLALALLVFFSLGMAGMASLRGAPRPESTLLGGSGYLVPSRRRVQALHALLSLLYIIGIMVLVLAALVRLQLVGARFSPGVLRSFPLALAGYVTLLALAAHWRIQEQGGVVRAWYTRVHGVFLALMGAAILAVGLFLTFVERVETGGGLRVLDRNDLEVLALAGLLGVGTQLFLAANLPTAFDLAARLMRSGKKQPGEKAAAASTPPFVYAGLIALAVTGILGFVFSQVNVVGLLGNFQDTRVAYLLLLFPIFLIAFFGLSAYQIRRESQRGVFKRKLPPQTKLALFVYATAGTLGLLFATLLVMNLTGRLGSLGPIAADKNLSKDLILLTILGSSAPVGFFLSKQNKRVDAVEARLPDFLNDLAETRRAGLTLAAALQSCALSDYGLLSGEVRKMARQVGWGVPFDQALAQFAQRVPTPLVRRTTFLIIEASRTGGSVAEILKAAAKDAYELKGLTQERRTAMATYLIVIYVVFAVFVAVIAVLDVQFIPQVIAANQAVGNVTAAGGTSPIGGGVLDGPSIRFSYYLAAIVQSIGNGIVGGVLSEGRISAGLRHVAIMSLLAWLMFRVLLG